MFKLICEPQENDKYKGPASNTIEDNYSPDRDINFNNDRDLGNDNNSNLDTGSLHHPIVLSDSEEEDGNNSDDSFNPNVDEESEQEDEEEAGSAALRGRSSSHDSELVADDNLPSHHFDDDDSSTVYPASDEESFHDYHSISNDDDIYGHDTFSNEIYSVDSDSSSTYDAHDDDSTFSNDESASVTDDRESFNFNDVFGNDAPFMDEEEYNYGDISSDDVVDDDDDDAVSSEIEELASNFRPAAKRSPPTNDDPRTQNTGSEDSRDRSQEGKRKGDELASEHAKKVRTTWLSTDSPDPAESANSSSLAWTVSLLKLRSNIKHQANTDLAASSRRYRWIRAAWHASCRVFDSCTKPANQFAISDHEFSPPPMGWQRNYDGNTLGHH